MSAVGRKRPRRRRVPGKLNASVYERADGKYEIGYRDSAGKQRWRGPFATVTAARAARDTIGAAKGRGERVQPRPRLRFDEAADRWLAEQVVDLRESTRDGYQRSVDRYLRPLWGVRSLDSIDVDDAALLVRALRSRGLAETTIVNVLKAGSRIFKFARRRMGWRGDNPIAALDKDERPKVSGAPERRIYEGDELEQVLEATKEPWRTLFDLAAVVGGRESELLALWWENLGLEHVDAAWVRFTHQVDRKGRRVELKTEESKATLPLPRATALMLLAHRERSTYTGPRAFVFSTRTGRPFGQRNVLRALHRAQLLARRADGTPTFPDLFEHDERGRLKIDVSQRDPALVERGGFVPRKLARRELPPLPHFHALRHTAAMDCEDAEEARDLLRHKNSNVTRAIYRAHFDDRRRENLRAKMESRLQARERKRQPHA